MNHEPGIGSLFTDFYELTMAASYHAHGIFQPATFSLFIRDNDASRNYYVVAGLEEVLNHLTQFRFSADDIDYLRGLDRFSDTFLNHLEKLRFSGQVYAMPEGTVCFANEPILEITAPIMEAQLLETYLLNTIGFQTLIATKAARCIQAAQGRPLIDFSLRRTQGHDAGIKVARSTYLAGFTATSNVQAGKIYDIPVSGTMAHSYVAAFPDEVQAFEAYAKTFPDHSVFLIDTYDTLEGARNAVRVARRMEKEGKTLLGVRLDSGDMEALSCKVRKILDADGLQAVKIYASSGFDEFKIAQALAAGASIDAFGVGTKVGVSADAPYLDVVYKLVRFKDRDVRKLSPGKQTLAGEKQVFRLLNHDRGLAEDIIGCRHESFAGSSPLLEKVMSGGRILQKPPCLEVIRERFQKNFARLDNKYKSIRAPQIYPIRLSPQLAVRQQAHAAGNGNGVQQGG